MPPNGYVTGDYYSNNQYSHNQSPQDWEPSPTSYRSSPRSLDGSGLELADAARIDPDVKRQLDAGLIDANDIVDTSSDQLSGAPRQVYRRKVKKLVEVPVTRKVKVPTTEPVVVPAKEQRRIMVKRQVPVTTEKTVEEAYTDIEQRQATRMKEVWVKKMVPETYTKNVEVRKTRTVKVPETTFREVESEQVIEVEGTRVENQPAWRVDEIKDTKMVEIEGWQEVELVPRIRDTNIRVERTYERQSPRRRVERKIGTNVLDDADHRLDNVDTDSEGESAEVTSSGRVMLDGSEHRTKPSKRVRRVDYRSHRFLTEALESESNTCDAEPQLPVSLPPVSSPKYIPSPPSARSSVSSASTPRGTKMFGLRMSAKRDGLHVGEVAAGGFAADAGLVPGDVVTGVDEVNITTVKSWRAALAAKKSGEFLSLNIKSVDGKTRFSTIKLENFNPSHYL